MSVSDEPVRSQTTVPDFGKLQSTVHGVLIECKAAVPGLSIHDLVMVFEKAKREATPADNLAGNPSRWGDVRGVKAVVDAVLAAIYQEQKP